jgi:PAS domain S-box-containing protein
MTGYTFEDYLAAGGWEAHVHPDDRKRDELDMEVLSSNKDVKTDIRTIHKSGEVRWERVSAHPIWDEKQNRLVGIVGAVEDVTDAKRADDVLKESYLQQAAILNNIPDMAWLKDRNGVYVAINEQFSMVSGKSAGEVIGKSDLEIWNQDFAKKYRNDDEFVIKTKQRRSAEEKQQDHTGREYWVETVKTPIFNASGEVIGTTGIAREITERKLAEFHQQHRREMLEKVVELGKYVTEPDNLRATIKKIWHGVHDTLEFDRPAIFLYNQELHQMDNILGTDHQGQMMDNLGMSFTVGEGTEGTTFGNILKNPDGYYFTKNYANENNLPPGHEMEKVRDYAAVAAWAGNKPVAVICADNSITQQPITEAQLEALRLFSGYAGLAIENARLQETIQNELAQQILSEERERERRAILEKVVKLGQHVTEVNDLRTTLSRVWYGVRNDLGFDRIEVYLYDPSLNSMTGSFGTGDQGEMLDEWHVSIPLEQVNPESKSFTRVMEKPDTIHVTRNYESDFAAIAAWAGKKPMAVLRVDNKITGRPISNEQLEALRLFAGYVGLAIENSRLNTALQSELAQRKSFIEELEAKNAELERFTYTVSHDLKSPLVTITGFLGYIERDAYAGNLEKLKNNIERVNAAVEKMQWLLHDLLELSRIGRLINPPVEIAFREIVKDATEIVQGHIKARNVFVEFHDNNDIVKGDQVRLVEVLQNLLDNAVKFMGDQPNPHIEINSFINGEGKTVFFVRDNGMGIARQYHEKIFGLFNKLNTDTSGTGIGLTLIKRIIEVHGGRIWVESDVNKGTTFYFTLQ